VDELVKDMKKLEVDHDKLEENNKESNRIEFNRAKDQVRQLPF
jgi:hypothetical protein